MARPLIRYLARALAIAIVALIGAGAWFVLAFDANDYRAVIADAVSRAISRRVEILGDIEVTPALLPTLAVNGVTIANPPWASRPVMASAGRLEITLALLPLLEGKIEVRHAALERVDARLERDATGRGNWELAFLTDVQATQPAARYETEIGEVELREIAVQYAGADGAELATRVEHIALHRRPSGAIEIEGAGRLGELPVRVRWEAGPLDQRGSDPELRWPVRASAEIGEVGLELTGRLRAPLAYARSEFDLRITGRDARWWQGLVDRAPTQTSAYQVGGHVRVDERSVRLSGLSGELAIGEGVASARLDAGHVVLARGEPVETSLEGSVSGLPWTVSGRLGTVAEIVGEAPWPADLRLTLGDVRLETRGDVAPLASRASLEIAASGDLVAALQRVVPWALPDLGPIVLESRLKLERASASFEDLALALGPGTVTGALSLQGTLARPSIVADLRAQGLDLARLRAAGAAASSESWLDRSLPLDWLGRADAAVMLAVDELRGLPFPVGGVAARAQLTDGALELTIDEAHIAGVATTGSARLGRVGNRARVDAILSAPSIELDRVLGAIDVAIELDVEAAAEQVRIEMQTIGSNLRAVANAAAVTLRTGPAELGLGLARDSPSVAARRSSLRLDSLRLDAARDARLRLETRGRLLAEARGRPLEQSFELTAMTGTLAELLRAQQPWPAVELSVASDYLRAPVAITARVDDPAALVRRELTAVTADASWGSLHGNAAVALVPAPGLVGSTAELRLDAADLTAAGALLGVTGLPAGEAALAGRLAVGSQRLELALAEIVAAGIRGSGELSLEQGPAPALRGALDLAVLDLTPYLARPAPDAEDGSTVALHRLYSTQPLARVPRDRNVAISILAQEFRVGDFASREASLGLALGDGVLDVEAVLDGGQLRSHVRIDASSGVPDLELQTSGTAVALALERSGAPAAGTPVIDFAATLSGRGQSSRALAESLDGDALVYLRGGRIESGGLRFLFGSVLYQLLDVINPFSERQTHIDIECAGVYFEVVDGVVSTEKGIVVQTPELQVIGVGNTNLADGELMMRFRTKRRTGVVVSLGGIVNEFVQLTGTLGAPRVELSPERAAGRGALAIATGGLSLLATDLFNRMTARDVCADLPTIVGAPGTIDDAR